MFKILKFVFSKTRLLLFFLKYIFVFFVKLDMFENLSIEKICYIKIFLAKTLAKLNINICYKY